MADGREGPQKDYKHGNTNPDGSYRVGKGKPPESGKFRAGDGRDRGRRKKDTRNLATDFREELESKVTLKVDGKPRKVTKQRAVMMRLMDNASRGQNVAIKTIMAYADRFGIEVQTAEPEPDNPYPFLKDLSDEEFELLGKLLEKASGVEFEKPILPENPFAYVSDPEDPRNYMEERTVEGVHVRRYRDDRFCDRIDRIEGRAYHSAALPRKPGCFRETM